MLERRGRIVSLPTMHEKGRIASSTGREYEFDHVLCSDKLFIGEDVVLTFDPVTMRLKGISIYTPLKPKRIIKPKTVAASAEVIPPVSAKAQHRAVASVREVFKRSPLPEFEMTDEFEAALSIMENTQGNCFITGKAGTGKSLLLRYFVEKTNKKIAVVAPTGIAAYNVEGQTIHSFFKFPPHTLTEGWLKGRRFETSTFALLDTLVIDEVSMVRADVFDAMDFALRIAKKNDKPFGGVQVLLFGDLFQLPPVLGTDAEKRFFADYYACESFFFAAHCIKSLDFKYIELTRVFRQDDERFVRILNKVREGKATDDDFWILNNRRKTLDSYFSDAVLLGTTNKIVDETNRRHLAFLQGEPYCYTARIEAVIQGALIEEEEYPAEKAIYLKKGAKIILLKNDPAGRWANGTRAEIIECKENGVLVRSEEGDYFVQREEWQIIRQYYDEATKTIKPYVAGIFEQLPVRLAWALTIHKSQGQTLEKAIIDLGKGAFDSGQLYVALSRCRSLDTIAFESIIKKKDMKTDQAVIEFINHLVVANRMKQKGITL